MREIQNFINKLFKKKEVIESDVNDNNYIDIALGLSPEGQIYFNFFKEGEQKNYEEFSQEERNIIIQMMAQSSAVFARIEKQASQNKNKNKNYIS